MTNLFAPLTADLMTRLYSVIDAKFRRVPRQADDVRCAAELQLAGCGARECHLWTGINIMTFKVVITL